jgi:hypothetical protein
MIVENFTYSFEAIADPKAVIFGWGIENRVTCVKNLC